MSPTRAREAIDLALKTLLATAVATLVIVAVSAPRAEESAEDVKPERWVATVKIKTEDGAHTGPTWYIRQTFDTKGACDEFLQSEGWRATFIAWARQEIAQHDGKVEIPAPVCVQRLEIQDYANDKGA